MSLAGRHVVVTRPAGQASHLAEALSAEGAIPVLFPVLEIRDIDDPTPVLDAAIRLDSYDLAVFVSPNAIDKALGPILARRPWPDHLMAAVLGKSSEQALTQRGIDRIISPPLRFDSEALLDLPELTDVRGKRVVLFRGEGGRELLADTLTARGAIVDPVACYRRVKPDADASGLHALWETGRLDAVTLTSSEGVRHFADMIGPLGLAWLRKTPTFVPHARIAEQAAALGLREVIATAPADSGLIAALVQYFGRDGKANA